MGAFREWGGTFSDLERELAHLPAPDPFTVEELDGLPQPVQQHFTTTIAADTPIATSARLRMKGQIKVKRWLPFRARQLLSPHHGFVWSGRAAGVIVGSDRYVDGHGVLDWKIAGLIPVAHADGSDISRSAAGRGAAEAIWVPTALLPRFGVRWTTNDVDKVTASFRVADVPVEFIVQLDGDGHVWSIVFERWGDPDNSGTFDWHPFGGEIESQRSFDGVTIPASGRVGWFYGTDRWAEGEFFRFEIVDLELMR